MPRIRRIETAAGVALALISTEHFYSAGMSSPITTRKFLTEGEDRQEVQRAVSLASLLSLATGAFLSASLRNPWPILSSIGLVAFYNHEYERALATPPALEAG